jgi:hypothetical protein
MTTFDNLTPSSMACVVTVFFIPWLIMVYVMYCIRSSEYTAVIANETGEWSKGVIVDFAAVT